MTSNQIKFNISHELIAFYVPSFRGGGAEKAWVYLANEFNKKGFRVDFIVAQMEGPYISSLAPTIKLINFNASNLFTTIPLLVNYLRTNRPTILLSTLNHTNLISLISKKISFCPTKNLISIQNYLSLHAQNSSSVKDKIIPYLAKIAYPFSDCIVAVSSGVASDLSKLTGISLDKINVIVNPIVTNELFFLSKEPVEHKWLQNKEVPVIIGIGRFVKQKNFSLLIKSFKLVTKEISARLIILGEGEERDQLQKLINDLQLSHCVSLPGFVQNPYNYIANSSLFVLSSLWEGFGNVVVEALACGTSVVSTNCKSGPSEILEDGKYGTLVPIDDAEVLASAIIYRLKNPFVAETLVNRAKNYTSEKIFNQYYKLLFSDSIT